MNDQNKKQIIIAAVLGVVLVGVLVYQFVLSAPPPPPTTGTQKTQTQKAAPRTTRTAASTAQTAAVAPEEIDLKSMIASVEVKPIDYPAVRIARSPMTPLVGQMRPQAAAGTDEEGVDEVLTQISIDTTASKQISGIIWDDDYPVAIVDDVVVHIGYRFPNGALVHQIDRTRVLFKVGDTIIPVEMKEY